MNTMDRKIAQRRHRVTEQRAQTRLRIVIGLVALTVVIGAGWWLLRSPFLSIDTVAVTGADHTDVPAVLERLGVGAGTPTISVDEAAIETALGASPWVAESSVVTTWPGTLEIEIVEHAPVAAFQRGDALVSVTRTGAIVEQLQDVGTWPLVVSDGAAPRPGEVMSSPATLGALEFVAALPGELASGAVVTVGRDGLLTATVAGHPVRLGRAVDLAPKAAALAAVLGSGVEAGSTIDVTAPRHPAVGEPSSSG